MKEKIMLVLVSLLGVTSMLSCAPNTNNDSSDRVVKDMMNREVVIPSQVDKVVCIGAGALRLYSYVGDMNKLSGVEMVEKSTSPVKIPKRPYQVANQQLIDGLPECGLGGPKGQQADYEKIIACHPDVVFSLIKDVDAMNEVTKKTKTPVVILDYGHKGAFELKEEDNKLLKSIALLGNVLNLNERATTVTNLIKEQINDIHNRTKDIAEADKPGVYLGGLGNFGMKGLNSSQANYPLLQVANIKNVLDDTGLTETKEMEIDPEILNSINPDYVFMDAGGIGKTNEQFSDPSSPLPTIYRKWNAFVNDKAFVMLPYKVYYMQIEVGLIDAYYIGKTVYPEAFEDVDINNKAKELFEAFNQKDCYESYLSATNLTNAVFAPITNE